jgi:predicted nuclease of predicted toxin-antitoxin system
MKTILKGGTPVKFLLDQGLPRSLASLLRREGIDAIHVGEKHLSEATDAEILEYARESDLTIITHDADFHTLIALANAAKPSVIRIRIEGLKSPQLYSLVQRILESFKQEIGNGALVSVTNERIRLRSLPIY